MDWTDRTAAEGPRRRGSLDGALGAGVAPADLGDPCDSAGGGGRRRGRGDVADDGDEHHHHIPVRSPDRLDTKLASSPPRHHRHAAYTNAYTGLSSIETLKRASSLNSNSSKGTASSKHRHGSSHHSSHHRQKSSSNSVSSSASTLNGGYPSNTTASSSSSSFSSYNGHHQHSHHHSSSHHYHHSHQQQGSATHSPFPFSASTSAFSSYPSSVYSSRSSSRSASPAPSSAGATMVNVGGGLGLGGEAGRGVKMSRSTGPDGIEVDSPTSMTSQVDADAISVNPSFTGATTSYEVASTEVTPQTLVMTLFTRIVRVILTTLAVILTIYVFVFSYVMTSLMRSLQLCNDSIPAVLAVMAVTLECSVKVAGKVASVVGRVGGRLATVGGRWGRWVGDVYGSYLDPLVNRMFDTVIPLAMEGLSQLRSAATGRDSSSTSTTSSSTTSSSSTNATNSRPASPPHHYHHSLYDPLPPSPRRPQNVSTTTPATTTGFATPISRGSFHPGALRAGNNTHGFMTPDVDGGEYDPSIIGESVEASREPTRPASPMRASPLQQQQTLPEVAEVESASMTPKAALRRRASAPFNPHASDRDVYAHLSASGVGMANDFRASASSSLAGSPPAFTFKDGELWDDESDEEADEAREDAGDDDSLMQGGRRRRRGAQWRAAPAAEEITTEELNVGAGEAEEERRGRWRGFGRVGGGRGQYQQQQPRAEPPIVHGQAPGMRRAFTTGAQGERGAAAAKAAATSQPQGPHGLREQGRSASSGGPGLRPKRSWEGFGFSWRWSFTSATSSDSGLSYDSGYSSCHDKVY
ncbi:hypothetical protein HK101_001247 [Irineochytrium annulatum]|nr:hypothetical protein HK101_001247 [Irineochytrium annulatum]